MATRRAPSKPPRKTTDAAAARPRKTKDPSPGESADGGTPTAARRGASDTKRARLPVRDARDAVADACLWLPEVTQTVAHGMADYKVRGKTFATLAINHHGDGRLALWLAAPSGAQAHHVANAPKRYFVPPYVGPRGWLGARLDAGLGWNVIAQRILEAYQQVAPAALLRDLPRPPAITPPEITIDPEVFDPLSPPPIAAKVAALRAYCLALPESSEAAQFGQPSWRVGKKTFCTVSRYSRVLRVSAWVGPEQQAMLTFAPHYRIPAYTGHNGWIDIDIEATPRWDEVAHITLLSYRHFATRRALSQLDALGPPPSPTARR